MNDAKNTDRMFIANCSLLLFVAGLYVPHVVSLVSSMFSLPVAGYIWAVRFAFVAELLAFILGIFGRQHFSAKVAMYGASSLILLELTSLLWTYSTR